MRRLLGIVAVVVLLIAVCTPPPALVTPAVSPTAAPVARATGARAVTTEVAPTSTLAATAAVSATVAPPATVDVNDKTAPSISLIVDPPQIDWTSQATLTARASDPAGIKSIEVLLGDQVLGTGDGEELEVEFIPGAIDGLQGGTVYTLLARATDLAGNVAVTSGQIQVGVAPKGLAPRPTDTPAPAAAGSRQAAPTATQSPASAASKPAVTSPQVTPAPAATAAPSGAGTDVIPSTDRGTTTYRVTAIQLPTYPYAQFLKPITDPDRIDYPVLSFDRSAYSASNPQPQMQTYRLLVLENRYLRLGILPDLGGRIYECIFKPTGANEFYANSVVKPTEWGPPAPPYAPGANWWLGTGGLEWGFPVEEHGYEFGTVWGFDHAAQPDGGVMITVYTQTGPEKPFVNVDIILPPDTAYFVVQPRIVNPTAGPFKFKFWSNAMLAPGKANSVSPDLRFIFPATQVTVHSTGDAGLPQAGQAASWPMMGGRDLSRLGNWGKYLGFFATPATANFAGVYDPGADEGVVRVFPRDVAKGVKVFAPPGLDPGIWTDDGSTYVELHGGLMPTFADWYELGPQDEVTWSEFWYPVAKIGGVTFANDRAALSLAPSQGGVRLGLFPTTAVAGKLTVTLPGVAPQTLDVQLSPDKPFVRDFATAVAGGQGQVRVTLVAGGETILDWSGEIERR